MAGTMRRLRVAVTGAAGFIGRAVVARLDGGREGRASAIPFWGGASISTDRSRCLTRSPERTGRSSCTPARSRHWDAETGR